MSAPERILYPEEVEHDIGRLSRLLEVATDALAETSEAAANAEADYRVKYAQAFYRPDRFETDIPDKLTEKLREAIATAACEVELRAFKVGMAKQLSLQEKCRQLRAQMDALRTISANIRGQV